jgi:putative IMPACT (imprinted ancient) family translation regulator
LRHQDLEGVLATVVRYFGGIKLGAGGLVRAYTDAVAQALRDAEKVPLLPMQDLICEVAYDLEGIVRREAALADVALLEVAHAAQVRFHLRLPQASAPSFRRRLQDLAQGRINWNE